jgi:inosine-uridine nucleoside N-ribohydrolase
MRLILRCLQILVCASALTAHAQRLILIDQDGSGPAGSNQMAMMMLLQSPRAKVLGITMVSGNAWEPEEVAHTLRMLELIHRTDVPVVPGAIFPLLRTEAEANAQKPLIGTFSWYGAWGDLAAHTSRQPYHAPFVLPPMAEGEPTTKPLAMRAFRMRSAAGVSSVI